MDDTRRRFFIVNPGRCGSSLLAAIMADAGADFGMRVPDDWHPGEGELEHPTMVRAVRRFESAYAIGADRPAGWRRRWRWDAARHKGKRELRRALSEALWFKADGLDLVVRPALQLGYRPTVILNFRRFGPHAASLFLRRGHLTVETLAARYDRICRNGLMLLEVFGGAAVDYAELIDREETAWASGLARATGLERDRILEARARRLSQGQPADRELPVLDREAERLYEAMRFLSGTAISPSPPAERAWSHQETKLGRR